MMQKTYRIDYEALLLTMSAKTSVRVAGSATRKVCKFPGVFISDTPSTSDLISARLFMANREFNMPEI